MASTKSEHTHDRPRIQLGRAAAEKIQAVEGITLSAEMKRMFESFESEQLPHGERRRRLIERFGRNTP